MTVLVGIDEEEVAGAGAGLVIVGTLAEDGDRLCVEGVDLALILDDVVDHITLVGAEREAVVVDLLVLPTRTGRTGRGGTGTHVDGAVPVGVGGRARGDEPVTVQLLLVTEGELPSLVADFTEVGRNAVETGRRTDGLREDEVVGVTDEVVDREGQAVLPEGHVETDVGLDGGLPVETLVDLTALDDTVLAVHRTVGLKEVKGTAARGELGNGGGGVDVGVTGLTPTGAQAEGIEDAERLDELLVAEVPTEGERREGSPALVLAEVRGTVATDRSGQHVTAVIDVVETGEVGSEADLVVRTSTTVVPGVLVLGIETAQEREGQVLGAGAVARTLGQVGRLTDHGGDMVLAESIVIGQVVLCTHADGSAAARAEAVRLRSTLGVVVVVVVLRAHQGVAVAPAVAAAEVVVEVGAEGQALEEGDLDVSGVADVGAIAVIVDTQAGVVVLVEQRVALVTAAGLVAVGGVTPYEVAVGAVLVLNGDMDELVGLQVDVVHGGDDTGVVDHVAAAFTLGGVEVDRVTGLEPLRDVEVGAQTEGQALVPGVHDDTLVVEVTNREARPRSVGTAGNREIVLLTIGSLGHHVLPVDVVELAVIGTGEGRERGHTVIGRGSTVGREELCKRSHFDTMGVLRDTEVGAEVDAGLAGLRLLRGHEDNAIGSAGTVDGGGGSVLQDLDALDILGIEPAEVGVGAVLDTVDNPQRVGVAVHGSDTADADAVTAGRVTGRLGDDHTGSGALQTLGKGGRNALQHGLGVNGCDRTGHVALLLGTVTDHHGLLKEHIILLEDEINRALSPSEGDFLVGIADAGGDEGGIGRNVRNCKGSVGVGGSTDRGRTLHKHARGDDGFAVSVLNRTCDSVLGKCGDACAQREQDGHECRFKMILHHKTD